jgi:predicted signal transduction protein with EAL and GGDEF domain
MELAATALRLIEMLRLPVDIDGTAIIPTCSVGIALAREGDDIEAVMRHADAALYEAKTHGRDRYEIFDDARRDVLQDRLQLETNLRHALLERRFEPWFQPEHDIETGAVLGVEALVRWNHAEREMVAAHEFIDVAEEMGLAPQLSRLVMDRSLDAVRRWQDEGQVTRVRVNVAGGQLQSAEFHSEIGGALERSGLDPGQLCVEITERALMLDLRTAVVSLEHVRAMGVEVAVDDFGTGLSSLARLKDLPVDTLKIDRSFVSGIVGSTTDREIVRTIIGLGRGLGLDVVAEGVESEAQAELLLELGCGRAQGWLWSRAMRSDEVPPFLAAREPDRSSGRRRD